MNRIFCEERKMKKIFFFGIDNAGKTAIITFLSTGMIPDFTLPTIVANKTMLNRDLGIAIWDMAGQINFRNLWEQYVQHANLLVFILDTSDKNRFQEAKDTFIQFIKSVYMIKQYLTTFDAPIIFCFHKMDLSNAKQNVSDAKSYLELEKLNEYKIHQIETSIRDIPSLNRLNNLIEDLVKK